MRDNCFVSYCWFCFFVFFFKNLIIYLFLFSVHVRPLCVIVQFEHPHHHVYRNF